jgi:hypothetical protein
MENHHRDNNSWLHELSNQSWNLELLVSGAAIFSTSFLPEFVEQITYSYFENYQTNNEITSVVFPNLAFSFAKASAYLLIATFFIHFVLRAFWIALVGLRAVYPQGIIFEKLPNTNNELREIYKKWFGTFDDFIVKLDKKCSRIFSIAFILVLFSVMISVGYLITFVGIVLFKTYQPELYSKVKILVTIGFWMFMAMNILILFAMSKEKYRENPVLSKWYVRIIKAMSWLYLGMYKPLSYINFVFASHLPRKTYYTYMILLMVSFSLLAMSIYSKTLLEHVGVPFMESRKFYFSGSADYQLHDNYYDNQRTEGESIAAASIQADIITEPFVKLFINYPKVFDADLSKICKTPNIPDSLQNRQKRLIKDQAHLECFGQYFQIALNDSTLSPVEFFYAERGATQTKGLTTYLSTQKCKVGRNTLFIKTLQIDSLPRKTWSNYVAIPFWYAKN